MTISVHGSSCVAILVHFRILQVVFALYACIHRLTLVYIICVLKSAFNSESLDVICVIDRSLISTWKSCRECVVCSISIGSELEMIGKQRLYAVCIDVEQKIHRFYPVVVDSEMSILKTTVSLRVH